jgi:uncharacterized DUF497 family protein
VNVSFAGFDWDEGNREKCLKHGVSLDEIEALFFGPIAIRPDLAHSVGETRFLGIGGTAGGRHVFIAFTIRRRDSANYIRPISARYMHRKEVEQYEKANP